jgi:hypothetical protein
MFRVILRKFAVGAGIFIQYAAVTHCCFEYLGDFVIVSFIQDSSSQNRRILLSNHRNLTRKITHSFQCSGPSMLPTLEQDNILLTDRISPRLQVSDL